MNVPVPAQSILPINSSTNQQQDVIANELSELSNDNVADPIKIAVLQYRIDQIIKQNESEGITTSVAITNLKSGKILVDHNTSAVQYAASINKLPIAWLLLQDLRAGKVSLQQQLAWQDSDVRAGYGVYDQPGAPLSGTLHDVLYDMLNHSGNTAVRVIVNNVLGGADAVNTRLAQYPQLIQTRLQPLDSTHFYVGNTTADEALWVMEQLQSQKDSYEQVMQSALANNIFVSYGVRSQLQGNNFITLANKVGILDDPTGNNRHDVGIIYNSQTGHSFAYSFMTTNMDTSGMQTMDAEASLQQMGRDTLRLAGDKPVRGSQNSSVAPRDGSSQQAESDAFGRKVLY